MSVGLLSLLAVKNMILGDLLRAGIASVCLWLTDILEQHAWSTLLSVPQKVALLAR